MEIVSIVFVYRLHVACVSVFLSSYLTSVVYVRGSRFVQNADFITEEAMTHSDFYWK